MIDHTYYLIRLKSPFEPGYGQVNHYWVLYPATYQSGRIRILEWRYIHVISVCIESDHLFATKWIVLAPNGSPYSKPISGRHLIRIRSKIIKRYFNGSLLRQPAQRNTRPANLFTNWYWVRGWVNQTGAKRVGTSYHVSEGNDLQERLNIMPRVVCMAGLDFRSRQQPNVRP